MSVKQSIFFFETKTINLRYEAQIILAVKKKLKLSITSSQWSILANS